MKCGDVLTGILWVRREREFLCACRRLEFVQCGDLASVHYRMAGGILRVGETVQVDKLLAAKVAGYGSHPGDW